jgi:hypothetical protein
MDFAFLVVIDPSSFVESEEDSIPGKPFVASSYQDSLLNWVLQEHHQ